MKSFTLTWLVAAVLLACAPSVVAQEVIKIEGATLAEVRAKLFGQAGQSGLLSGTKRFEADFTGITLSTQDTPELLNLIQEAASLPLRSQVTIAGTIDEAPFKAKMETTRSGRTEVKLKGLTFPDYPQVLNLLTVLLGRGVKELKVEGFVGNRPIEVKFEEGPPRVDVKADEETQKPTQ